MCEASAKRGKAITTYSLLAIELAPVPSLLEESAIFIDNPGGRVTGPFPAPSDLLSVVADELIVGRVIGEERLSNINIPAFRVVSLGDSWLLAIPLGKGCGCLRIAGVKGTSQGLGGSTQGEEPAVVGFQVAQADNASISALSAMRTKEFEPLACPRPHLGGLVVHVAGLELDPLVVGMQALPRAKVDALPVIRLKEAINSLLEISIAMTSCESGAVYSGIFSQHLSDLSHVNAWGSVKVGQSPATSDPRHRLPMGPESQEPKG